MSIIEEEFIFRLIEKDDGAWVWGVSPKTDDVGRTIKIDKNSRMANLSEAVIVPRPQEVYRFDPQCNSNSIP